MRKKLGVYSILLGLMLTPMAVSANWVHYENSLDGYRYEYKSSSVRVLKSNQNIKQVWQRAVSNGVVKYRILTQFDCASDRVRVLQWSEYDERGRVIEEENEAGAWSYITPDTMNAQLYRHICQKR